jgi:hypothetical protein
LDLFRNGIGDHASAFSMKNTKGIRSSSLTSPKKVAGFPSHAEVGQWTGHDAVWVKILPLWPCVFVGNSPTFPQI